MFHSVVMMFLYDGKTISKTLHSFFLKCLTLQFGPVMCPMVNTLQTMR